MCHKQLNYALLLFWSIFGEILRELLFFVKKRQSQKEAQNTHRVFFLTCLKRAIPEEYLDLFKQMFLIKPLKGDNINKNCFSFQSEPHTAKLSFPVVLNQFRANSLKTSLISPKIDYLRKEYRNTQKFFLKQIWKGANPEENLDLLIQLFLIKPVKWGIY